MAKVNFVRCSITIVFFALFNIEVSISGENRNFACEQVGPCRCKQLSGDLIDLSPLENLAGPEPKFLTAGNNQGLYFYHPCSDIVFNTSVKSECGNGCSLCLFLAESPMNAPLDPKDVLASKVKGMFMCLALAREAIFQPSETEIHLIYKLSNVTTIINLECVESSSAESVLSLKSAASPINAANNNLVLSSPYACFQSKSHGKHYMSGFGVFCLILTILAAAYFFGGMLVLRCIKGATGIEMIPNYNFWVSVPSRIKTGFNHCLGRESAGPDSYERI